MPLPHLLPRWLPEGSHSGLWRRGALVAVVAGFIGLFNWAQKEYSLAVGMAYSYGISMSIWFCTDVLRVALHRWLGTEGPHFWRLSPRMVLFLLAGTVVGYLLGTAAGDAVGQRSTLALLWDSPRRFWGFLFSSLGISLAFLAFFYQREKGLALERQATEARLKLLETQLEPHMLFNTLANLRVLIQIDPPRALDMLDRLNGYLRATLKASRTDVTGGGHTLGAEFERLKDYLELMAVRMGDRLRYTLDLPEDLAAQPLPPLLLQPLVENAIRHGLEPKVSGGALVVSAQRQGPHLVVSVRDEGVGMAAPAGEAGLVASARGSGGFGLNQVRERLASLPGGGQIEVCSQPGEGTTIVLRLRLQPQSSATLPATPPAMPTSRPTSRSSAP